MIGGAISSFATITSVRALGLIESIIVARILGSVQFGILALALAILNPFSTLAGLGLPQAVVKHLSGEAAHSRAASRRVVRNASLLLAPSSLMASFAVLILGAFVLVPFYSQPEIWSLLAIGAALIALTGPLQIWASVLHGLGRITEMNALTFGGAVAGLMSAIVLSLLYSAQGALIAFFVPVSFVSGLAFRSATRRMRGLSAGEEILAGSPKSLLMYGLPLFLSGLIVPPTYYLVSSAIVQNNGYAELASFGVASVLANIVLFMGSAIGIPLVPVLSSLGASDERAGRVLVGRTIRITVFICTPVVVLLQMLSPEVVGLTYGPEFLPAAGLLVWLSLAALAASVTSVVGSQIAALGRTWWGLIQNVVWAAVVILSSQVLIPQFGAAGAAAAMLFGYSGMTLVTILIGFHVLKLDFSGLLGPVTWSGGLLAMSGTLMSLASSIRLPLTAAIISLGVLLMVRLMSDREKSLLRETLRLVGQAKAGKPGKP